MDNITGKSTPQSMQLSVQRFDNFKSTIRNFLIAEKEKGNDDWIVFAKENLKDLLKTGNSRMMRRVLASLAIEKNIVFQIAPKDSKYHLVKIKRPSMMKYVDNSYKEKNEIKEINTRYFDAQTFDVIIKRLKSYKEGDIDNSLLWVLVLFYEYLNEAVDERKWFCIADRALYLNISLSSDITPKLYDILTSVGLLAKFYVEERNLYLYKVTLTSEDREAAEAEIQGGKIDVYDDDVVAIGMNIRKRMPAIDNKPKKVTNMGKVISKIGIPESEYDENNFIEGENVTIDGNVVNVSEITLIASRLCAIATQAHNKYAVVKERQAFAFESLSKEYSNIQEEVEKLREENKRYKASIKEMEAFFEKIVSESLDKYSATVMEELVSFSRKHQSIGSDVTKTQNKLVYAAMDLKKYLEGRLKITVANK